MPGLDAGHAGQHDGELIGASGAGEGVFVIGLAVAVVVEVAEGVGGDRLGENIGEGAEEAGEPGPDAVARALNEAGLDGIHRGLLELRDGRPGGRIRGRRLAEAGDGAGGDSLALVSEVALDGAVAGESGAGHVDHQLPAVIADASARRDGPGAVLKTVGERGLPAKPAPAVEGGGGDEDVTGERGRGEAVSVAVFEDEESLSGRVAWASPGPSEPGGENSDLGVQAVEVESDLGAPDAAALEGADAPELSEGEREGEGDAGDEVEEDAPGGGRGAGRLVIHGRAAGTPARGAGPRPGSSPECSRWSYESWRGGGSVPRVAAPVKAWQGVTVSIADLTAGVAENRSSGAHLATDGPQRAR
jgi:hypothetical protein